VLLALAFAIAAYASARAQGPTWLDAYRADATRLIHTATKDDFAWRRLAQVTDTFGHRLSSSDNMARAVAWAVAAMKEDGLENVRADKVMVPNWVRGAESAEIVEPGRHTLSVIGLGGTVATPPGGLEAEVVVVSSFPELRAKAADVKGRIVLFDVAYTNYSETVVYRTGGARAAAELGAVAVLVRAVGPLGLRTPHTGSVQYMPGRPGIPALSLAAEDASRITRLTAAGKR